MQGELRLNLYEVVASNEIPVPRMGSSLHYIEGLSSFTTPKPKDYVRTPSAMGTLVRRWRRLLTQAVITYDRLRITPVVYN
jgi:hypothetical protein